MRERCDERGFTYLALIVAVALLGIGLAAAGQYWKGVERHRRITELRWVGKQYRNAVGSYYESSPGIQKRFPASMDDLLRDPRFVTERRYLRERYEDPITATDDWALLPAPDGGIMGVASPDVGDYASETFIYQPGMTTSLAHGESASVP